MFDNQLWYTGGQMKTEDVPEEFKLAMEYEPSHLIIAAMRAAFKLPDAEKCDFECALTPECLKDWTGGLVSGDGCITADKKHGLRVSVKQAEHGWDSLYQLHALFGGCIYDNKEQTDVWQAQKTWSLSGNCARAFCREMESHCILKREQMQEALRYPLFELKAMQMAPVMATTRGTDTVQLFGSQMHAIRVTGASNIQVSLRNPCRVCQNAYWTHVANPIQRGQVVLHQNTVIGNLKELKKVVHKSLDASMKPAFVAGLVDSDGCIDISMQGCRTVAVGQKHRAICDALKEQFGGGICQDKKTSCYHWKVCGENAKAMLQIVAPYLISKRRQAEIALGKSAGDAINVRAQMKVLKNRRHNNS